MSSRGYPPPPRGDRTPPRPFDRRGSSTYTPLNTSSSYRPSNDLQQSADRLPPRGPRAESFRGTFNSAPRGRGIPFTSRGVDSWDRERERDREPRTLPGAFRRDDDRPEWSRRDDRPPAFNRDRPTYVGRERSASPIRPRRDSKENIGSTFSRPQDSGPGYFGSSIRGGGERGRGRGGWDRSRGRSSFIGERDRDLFPNRSRSREGWREREFDRPRNFGPDREGNDRFERRDLDRAIDRDPRTREHDVWQRDQSPGRSSVGNRATSPGALSSISQDRKLDYDLSRKPLTSSTLQSRDTRRDAESDYFNNRNDGSRREVTFPQPPSVPAVPQSSSLGLDYGPPPSAPAAPPVVPVPEKPMQPQKSGKPDPPPPNGAPFQPPSGPKAGRGVSSGPSAQSSQLSAQQVDIRARPEPAARHRSQHLETPIGHPYEVPRTIDSALDRSSPAIGQGDRLPLPPNVPSGPRLGPGTPYKPKTSPVVQQTALPTVPLKAVNVEARSASIVPTGPRSASILPPFGPRGPVPTGPSSAQGGPASSSWRRPQIEYRPQKPSIMGNMNRAHMPDRQLPHAHMASKQSPKMSSAQMAAADNLAKEVKADLEPDSKAQSESKDTPYVSTDAGLSAPASEDEDEDADDEPESELDESYFADSERTHAREMDRLKAKMPLPILQDTAVVRLLIRIQLLGMIVNGTVPEGLHSIKDEKDVEMDDQTGEGLPSPHETPEEVHSPRLEHPKPRGRPLKEAPVNPIPTPPVEELPYRRAPAPDMVVFDEPLEDEVEEEKVTTLLRTQFEQDAWEEKDDLLELFDFYRQKFPEWKYEIDKYERMRRELEATPDPGSPGAQSAVSIPPSAERLTGRAARNATEFDIEKAILMSQQSAREEEERREREAASNAKPNYDTEALVPDMLKPAERDVSWRFQDTNFLVPVHLAVELMEYIPPEDDFTDEEQTKFITAFCQTPKKWGLIADQIPGRTYQECIAHYYLTKNEAHYKEIWRRSQPKRKRGRAATKPRSTALLSDMALNQDDPDATPAPVTDSGRPRRAAAPTFGDVPDAETAALPAAKRLAVAPKDATEAVPPKTTKGRKAGTATKVRRTKAQIAADQQALATQVNPDGSPIKGSSGRVRTLLRADNLSSKPDLGVPTGYSEAQQVVNAQVSPATAPVRQRSPPPPVVTSYWSVPEQQKFRQLVAYYGRDYAKIADFMKTKSQAMIKNHYSREVSKGDLELERAAQVAEEKMARGEAPGRLPSPIAPIKRKYDPTPPIAQTRPLTANVDAASGEPDRPATSIKGSLVDDFPANAIQRDPNGSIVAKPSPRSELLQHSPSIAPVQTKLEDFGRDRPLLAQKGLSGPPRGHFSDESFHSHVQQRQHGSISEQIPHHHPPQLVDLRTNTTTPQPRDLLSREQLLHGSSTLHVPRYRGLESERSMPPGRQLHSRNSSLLGAPTTFTEQQAVEAIALRDERSRMFGTGVTQSPRSQPMQASLAPRAEPFPAFAPLYQQQQSQQQQQHQHQQQYQQAQQPSSQVKTEAQKAAPAKRSNVFDLLSSDEPPARPIKRTSTDSAQRPQLQTPPPQSLTQNHAPYQSRLQEEMSRRPGMFGGPNQHHNHSSMSEIRGAYTNSPAPPHRVEAWLEKFDPRQSMTDRSNNDSPLYPAVPPAPASGSRNIGHGPGDGLRNADLIGSHRSNLGRSQNLSPPRQVTTPVPQFRSASAIPQPHSRMSSLVFGQGSLDHRQLQQQSQQGQQRQQQQMQAAISQPQSTGGTPISSMHHRGQQSIDFGPRRLTIQEYKAQGGSEQPHDPRDPREVQEHRFGREDAQPRGQPELQHRNIALPPHTQGFEQSRQAFDRRDVYRTEPPSHQVPPPPGRSSLAQTGFGAPARAYNSTPPLAGYGNDPRDARSMAASHNQHAHHHHHNLSTQPPPPPVPQQQQQQQQGPPSNNHHHHQQSLGMAQQPHQNIAPHSHQSQPSLHQQYREQPRFGQPPPQGLAPPPSHFGNYSQGGEERR